MDRQLETALFWIAQAIGDKLVVGAVTKFVTAIESLVVGPVLNVSIGKRRLSELVSTRIAALVSHSPGEAVSLKKKVERLYGLRSRVLHAGSTHVDDYSSLAFAGSLAAWGFLRFLQTREVGNFKLALLAVDKLWQRLEKNKPCF